MEISQKSKASKSNQWMNSYCGTKVCDATELAKQGVAEPLFVALSLILWLVLRSTCYNLGSE